MTEKSVEAVLLGGPDGIPAAERSRTVPDGEVKVKIPYLGGYEHFERRPDSESEVVAFHWTMRTRIAE
ncbi:DUF5988 family protein [Streptomyces sp. NPDC059894]|uniref:DUF5988 family protein n=1 Tax=unclassified Streptomyces TaxID=2593676 RepID=UPI0036609705